MKDHPQKRRGRGGSREVIDWIDAVQQLKGRVCPHRFEYLQLFALILDRQAGARDLRRRLSPMSPTVFIVQHKQLSY